MLSRVLWVPNSRKWSLGAFGKLAHYFVKIWLIFLSGEEISSVFVKVSFEVRTPQNKSTQDFRHILASVFTKAFTVCISF